MKIKFLFIKFIFVFFILMFFSCQSQTSSDIPSKVIKETNQGYIDIYNSSFFDQISAVYIKITGEDYDYSNDDRLQGGDRISPNNNRIFPVMGNEYYEVEVQIDSTNDTTTKATKIVGYVTENNTVSISF